MRRGAKKPKRLDITGKSRSFLTLRDLDYYRKYILINIKGSYLRAMVEPEGIEPSSERLSLRLSSGADHLLCFPPTPPMIGMPRSVSFLLMTVIKKNWQFTFTADFMPDVSRGPYTCDRPHYCGGSLCSYEFAVIVSV